MDLGGGNQNMIEVQQDHLQQVEYLISQSEQGNHVLFEPELVRHAFLENHITITEEDSYAVEPYIERLLGFPTLAEKKAYLGQLDNITLTKVVRTYFNIVENNLVENEVLRH